MGAGTPGESWGTGESKEGGVGAGKGGGGKVGGREGRGGSLQEEGRPMIGEWEKSWQAGWGQEVLRVNQEY